MKKLGLAVLLMSFLGCTSPEEVIIMPSADTMMMGGSMLPTIEYRCPMCATRYKTEYLAEQCIDRHESGS